MVRLNQRRMQEAMRRLGIQQQEIDAEKVIIETPDKRIIINSPQVVKVNLMGQDTFQITGNISEENREFEPSEEDIKLVVEKTGRSRDEVIKVLKETNGDIASSILKLSNE